MKKKNNTLIIVLGAIALMGVCCCGGLIFAGSQGFSLYQKMGAEYTEEVSAFMKKASDGGWDVNSVSDQIFMGDGNTTRVESTRIVLAELGKMGTFVKVDGAMRGFNDTTSNGVRTQTFSWHGTVTLSNGTSPLTVDMEKVGEAWKVTDIYLR